MSKQALGNAWSSVSVEREQHPTRGDPYERSRKADPAREL